MEWWVDGSGWNGQCSRIAVCNEDGYTLVKEYSDRYTNNEAEYVALMKAMEMAKAGDIIYSDSQLVVNQVNGKWKCHQEHLFPLMIRARKIKEEKGLVIKWVRRGENLAGHLLEVRK